MQEDVYTYEIVIKRHDDGKLVLAEAAGPEAKFQPVGSAVRDAIMSTMKTLE